MFSPDLVWIELSRSALVHNIVSVRAKLRDGVAMAPCIKANAYGHGVSLMAHALVEAGCEWLAVQHPADALRLREEGISVPIVVMGVVQPLLLPDLVRRDIRVFVSSVSDIEALAVAAREAGRTAKAHLEVDTGMTRYGVLLEDLPALLDAFERVSGVEMEALVTHFASAGGPRDNPPLLAQFEAFEKARQLVNARDIYPPVVHSAKSSAAIIYPDTQETMVRPGIFLYGYAGGAETARALAEEGIELVPVLSLKTGVSLVKEVPSGTLVGYDGTHETTRPTKVAVLPIGYADGLKRSLSNRGEVLVRGMRAPILGRVCMNVTMVDVTDIPGVAVGDEAVVIGEQGKEKITANDLAALCETIPYEILTSLPAELPRRWVA